MSELSAAGPNPSSQPSLSLPNGTPLQLPHLPVDPCLSPTRFSRRLSRKLIRPSTAPAIEDAVLLPFGSSGQPRGSRANNVVPHTGSGSYSMVVNGLEESLRTVSTREEDELDLAASPGLTLGLLSSPFAVSQVSSSQSLGADTRSVTDSQDLDWPTFIHAYASGRWDPHRTPNRPKMTNQIDEAPRTDAPKPNIEVKSTPAEPPQGLGGVDLLPPSVKITSLSTATENVEAQRTPAQPSGANSMLSQEQQPQKPTLPSGFINSTSSLKFHGLRTSIPLNLPPPSHRLRNSFSNVIASMPSENISSTTTAANAELQTTVATMRWAASRVDISPLALPSPEHELADPMRGVTAAIPCAHPPENYTDHLITPGGTRRSRLTEFWEGTTDIDEEKSRRHLSPMSDIREESKEDAQISQLIQAAAAPVTLAGSSLQTPAIDQKSLTSLLGSAPPATAPSRETYHAADIAQADYFGDVAAMAPPTAITVNSEILHESSVPNTTPPPGPVTRHEPIPIPEHGTVSVPAVARRIGLTRQFSSPLPAALPSKETRVFGGRIVSDVLHSPKPNRPSKEEQLFGELQHLVPPDPPDELERRRALYKYNIWNTGSDMNFDRIAHLAKLVFNTKGVVISLIDGGEVWHKSEWGLKVINFLRSTSFCGHSILQRGDEPMVVTDTHQDWRFARNPLVIGGPQIRFYAGAPLRTQDGFNVGTLAIMDDTPRDEFSPRQRHTLKEFAAIVIREMELWRDKIQLRIRDRIQNSMEQFSRECLEIDEESSTRERPESIGGSSMDKVYDRAAKLVKRTLDVEGVIVMDVSHCEVLETMGSEANVFVTMHFGDPANEMKKQKLTTEEYHKINVFFSRYPEGKISEGIIPACFRPFLPTHIQYALTVPIYNIDKQLFALICAYNASDHTKLFLEGHELSYLRAIGVIILSAVLKRRMILADKAKSLFISNISHELRTPLHGILAAAELLDDTPLNPSQLSYLQTVQACGTSLVETVNHVLDFTKLSGNAKSGGVEHVIMPSKVNLMQLVEEAVDGCWVGHRARTAMGDSGIGSVYSPPKEEGGESPVVTRRRHVETVIDIGYRKEGWTLKCEKGGIRRVLMNLFGNSLKFTADGCIHVMLHQLPRSEDDPPNKVKVELVVLDSGKGISQNFLKNQLFHPFSQENPLQTGTGLGLAIVSSIVTSEVVGGKVDVWSQEGVGTEIKVTFNAEVDDDEFGRIEVESNDMGPIKVEGGPLPSVSLVGLENPHKGTRLLERVLRSYLENWWHFKVRTGAANGDIIILNEDVTPVIAATENRDISRPFIVLSGARGNPSLMHVATEHERIGGFCRILYKPGGPTRLRAILKLAVYTKTFGTAPLSSSALYDTPTIPVPEEPGRFPRRNSEEGHSPFAKRPTIGPRSSSAHPALLYLPSTIEATEKEESRQFSPPVSSPTPLDDNASGESRGVLKTPEIVESFEPADLPLPQMILNAQESPENRTPNLETLTERLENGEHFRSPPTVVLETVGPENLKTDGSVSIAPELPTSAVIAVGDSGTLLKSSVQSGTGTDEKKFRVLVVEDNGILRNLLTKWLSNKGYDFRHAVDGQAGVSIYSKEGPFDVVLLDLSMPVLDGVSATAIIRQMEKEEPDVSRARILALTGMSSLEDKRRAFEAGVDGYLIKPVAFKILDEMFHKMGLT